MRRILYYLAITMLIYGCLSEKPSRTIKIDMGETKEPISEFIYGQFIEHLGRCIYGGIWAEMIQDRKFFYPIEYGSDPWAYDSSAFWNTGPYAYLNGSPWEVIGHDNTVSKDEQPSYVGDYTPRIQGLGSGTMTGIRQTGLGVLKNKDYVGSITLRGSPGSLPITLLLKGDTVGQILTQINSISDTYQKFPFEFTASFDHTDATLQIFTSGSGYFSIGTLSMMPADHINGWRRDVVELMQQLNAPIYRWPGGNFVSGYNWRDGVGDRDMRPPRKNPAWKGVESNDVGLHEYMDLMKILDAEPFIAVNTGLGTVEEVAEEISYCRDHFGTEMGKIRAENGHPDPFDITFWAVGNEMYGSWQLGHMPLGEYVKKHKQMAEAIWAVDPGAQLVAVGAVGEWSETMMRSSADHMNLISEHIYCREIEEVEYHTNQLAHNLERVAAAHRTYRQSLPGLAEKDIRIAMDEWNYWYGDYIYGELGVRYHHKDAIGVARGLHAMFRNSDLYYMANYAQTVNVIGCIKTTNTQSVFATTGLPLKLYRNHFAEIPVAVQTDSMLDIAAAVSKDKKWLSIAIVNPTEKSEQIGFDFDTYKVSKSGTQFLIHHEDPEAFNQPGMEPQVAIHESEHELNKNGVVVPGYSILLLKFDLP